MKVLGFAPDIYNRQLTELEYFQEEIDDALRCNALTESFFKGDFSHIETLAEAPNPALRLQNGEIIGLPCNPRESGIIRNEAYMRSGVINKNVWALDARNVHIGNPNWTTFAFKVAKSACAALDATGVLTVAVPSKLVMCDRGSFYRHIPEGIHAEYAFATMAIILPAIHSGGEAHFELDGISERRDIKPGNGWQYSVLTWYNDTTQEFPDLTTGPCLMLIYDIVHHPNYTRPTPHGNRKYVEAMREVLTTWKREYSVLRKVVCQLEDECGPDSSITNLKGVDAWRIKLLAPLCAELGFQLGFAHANWILEGPCTEAPMQDDDDDDDYYESYDEDLDVDFIGPTSATVALLCFMDSQGQLISERLNINHPIESIGRGIDPKEDKFQEQYYCKVRGERPQLTRGKLPNSACCPLILTRILGDLIVVPDYNKYVMVIWPNEHDHEVRHRN